MNSPILPVICGVALAAMSTAGISHYCTVRQFVSAFDQGVPVSSVPAGVPARGLPAPQTPAAEAAAPATLAENTESPPTAVPAGGEEKFFETLVSRLESLQNQNRDLQDQLAETNRDLMKLEFRVDTHSESFRPLPVSEPFMDTSFGEEPGVLPPRADPVFLPSYE